MALMSGSRGITALERASGVRNSRSSCKEPFFHFFLFANILSGLEIQPVGLWFRVEAFRLVFSFTCFFPPSVHVDERRRRISPFGKRCSKQPAVFHRRAFRSNLSKPTGRSREFRSHQRGLSFLGKPPVSKAAAGSNYFTRVTKYASPDRRIV